MNTLMHWYWDNPLAQRITWALIHFLWQGTLIAALLLVALRLLRNATAQIRWAAACMALGAMVIAPVITAYRIVPERPVSSVITRTDTAMTVASPGQITVPQSISPIPSAATSPQPIVHDHGEALSPIISCIFPFWLTGVFALSLWHLGGWLLLQHTRRRDTHAPTAQALAMFDALLHRLGVSRAVKLLESARLTVPAVVGWLRPAILLPVGALSGLTPSQLEAVLAHELAHVRRYDYLVGLLQALLETLLFYHPAVWWVSGRIRQESEYCCDDIALGACPDRRNYAEALAKVVELHLAMPHLAPAATAGQVVPRIRRILGLPAAGSPAGHRWLSAFLALICLSTTALIIHNGSARAQAPKAPAASAI